MKTTKTTRRFIEVNIADIVSAQENLRDAVPRLSNEGFGVFEGNDNQPDALASLALSEDSLQQAKYVELIEKHEPHIKTLADNMATMSLLEPIRVRPAEEKGKYDLIYGARRTLAWLFNYAKSAGKIPARITAEVVDSDDQDSLLSSLSENIRVEPSPIDEAKTFKRLEKNFGMKAQEIANVTGKDVKVVRERMKLLRLPAETQERVHLGTLSQKKALAILDGDKGKASETFSDPRRVPPLKDIEKLYNAQHDDLPSEYKSLITEEVRQVFAFWLNYEYAPRTEGPNRVTADQDQQGQCA